VDTLRDKMSVINYATLWVKFLCGIFQIVYTFYEVIY
jgi:hypothetical protein